MATFRSKADLVEDHVRGQILTGQLTPGRQLRISDVAREVGVSDIPVREAFAHLGASGLLRLEPHKPAVVAEIGISQIEELFAIRAELEGLAVEKAAALPSEQLAAVESVFAQLQDASGEDFAERNRAFHFAIYEVQPYPRLLSMISELWDASARCTVLFGSSDTAVDDTLAESRELLDALLAHDGATARRVLVAQKQRIAAWLIANVESAQPAP